MINFLENPLGIFSIPLGMPYPQPSFFFWNSPFHLLKTEGVNQRTSESTSKKTIRKCQEFIKICIEGCRFSLALIIYVQQIYWECERRERVLPAHAGRLFPSEPVSQYRCINLPKTGDNDRAHIEIMEAPCILTYSQCFFPDKCLI